MCEHDDPHTGTPDDVKTDFDFETNAPATCDECGNKFPIERLDPTDSAPLCPDCKYIDWDGEDSEDSCSTCYGEGEIGINSEEGPEECPDCDGTGIEGHIKCAECNGSGMNPWSEHLTTVMTGPGSAPVAECDTCNGDGNIPAPETSV